MIMITGLDHITVNMADREASFDFTRGAGA